MAGILEKAKYYHYYYIVVVGIDQFRVCNINYKQFQQIKSPLSVLPEYRVTGVYNPFLYHVLLFILTFLLPSHVCEYLFQKH